jgi:WD40 repeat protein
MKRSEALIVAALVLVAGCVLTFAMTLVSRRLRAEPRLATELVPVDSLPPDSYRTLGKGSITMAAFSPDGRTLATTTSRGLAFYDTADYRLRLWQPIEGRLSSHGASALVWSPDGQTVAVAGPALGLALFDPSTGRQTLTLAGSRNGFNTHFDWSPDGRYLAATDQGQYAEHVWLWDATTGERMAELHLTEYIPRPGGLAWSPDGRALAVTYAYDIMPPESNKPDELVIWDMSGAPVIARQWSLPDTSVSDLAWTPDGRYLIAISYDRIMDNPTVIRVLDPGDGRTIAATTVDSGPVEAMTLSPNGQQLAVGGYGQRAAVVYGIPDLSPQAEISVPSFYDHEIAWSPDGDRLVLSNGGEFFVWSLADRAIVAHVTISDDSARNLAWSPDSTRLAAIAQDSRTRVYAADTGELLFVAGERDPRQWWPQVAWSPDGRRLATTSDPQEDTGNTATTFVWSASGAPLVTIAGGLGAWSAADGSLNLLHDGRLQAWQVNTTSPLLMSETPLPDDGYYPSPTGELLAQTGYTQVAANALPTQGRIIIRRAVGLAQVAELSRPTMRYVHSLAWSPDGRYLAASYDNHDERGTYSHASITVWDTATWQVVRSFDNLLVSSHTLSWSPDSQWIAATVAPSQSNLTLYPLREAQPIREIDAHPQEVDSVAWSPDGRWIASSGYDDQVIIWDAAALLPAQR